MLAAVSLLAVSTAARADEPEEKAPAGSGAANDAPADAQPADTQPTDTKDGANDPAKKGEPADTGPKGSSQPGDASPPAGDVAPDVAHEKATPNGATGAADGKLPDKPGQATTPAPKKPKGHVGSFEFGSYGRVVAAMDGKAGPGRDADIVAHGSRLDEDNYVEAELRRDDEWDLSHTTTHAVITLAIASPLFHWDADFSIKMAVRNLYLEENNLGLKGLTVWAGSRMARGDDIYLLDYWPLDNLNTLGGGVSYKRNVSWAGLAGALHAGVSRPDAPFYHQSVVRPAPLDQFGTVPVELLDRQRVIGSLRLEYNQRLSDPEKGPGAGIKVVGYGEAHALPSGQREEKPRVFEDLPSDGGYVVGAELDAYTGHRDTYVNVFVRYATGLAAYGQWASPGELALDKTTDGAHELVVAAGGNAEWGPIGVMLGAYVRSFRDASQRLDYQDVDEGIVVVRPTVFLGDIAGISVEGSYQLGQRGVISGDATDPSASPSGPHLASLFRFGVVPFLTPGGRGDFTRPHIRFIYVLTARDDDAKNLYPEDDAFHRRDFDHFIGLGAEWWFNSSSYGS
jgi:maltoporin